MESGRLAGKVGAGALTARGEVRPGEEGPSGEAGRRGRARRPGSGCPGRPASRRAATPRGELSAGRPPLAPPPAGASAAFQSGAARPEGRVGPAWGRLADGPPRSWPNPLLFGRLRERRCLFPNVFRARARAGGAPFRDRGGGRGRAGGAGHTAALRAGDGPAWRERGSQELHRDVFASGLHSVSGRSFLPPAASSGEVVGIRGPACRVCSLVGTHRGSW